MVVHPLGRVRVNNRRKDGTRALITLLRKIASTRPEGK